jgi:hypothetical protein
MEGDVIGYGVGIGGILLAVGQLAWSRIFGDGAAHAQIVDQYMTRVTNLEARQAVLEGRVNEEMALRLAEQERASLLRRRVSVLEAVIVELGGTVPPDEYKVGGSD